MVKLFIANRAEIACRIALTAHRMGIATCGVFTPADARTRHVRVIQQMQKLAGGDLTENYLNQELLIQTAKHFKADAVHPGYGFLAENPDFAEKVLAAGLTWVGPDPAAMRKLGGKIEAKLVAATASVPVAPWTRLDSSANAAEIIKTFGLPLLIKAAHGGGGRGQRVVRQTSEFAEALRAAQSEAQRSFGSAEVFIEKFLEQPRHIEVQIIGDRHGNVFALGERDCTLQRRNQKLIEETPATVIDDKTRKALHAAARSLASAAGYTNAGTIEFLAQKNTKGDWEYYFMEMNARLQVEHPVTEMVTGLDLVELQFRVASGENLKPILKNPHFQGHAMELRLCAEDPQNNFLPTPGPITALQVPETNDLRVDSGYEPGDVVPQEYDSLVAKLILHGNSRDEVIKKLSRVLDNTLIAGTITNKFYLASVLQNQQFQTNNIHTRWVESHRELTDGTPETLDADLSYWGKKFSSELLVQRETDHRGQSNPTEKLISFVPDPALHGAAAPRGVCISGEFITEGNEGIKAAGWVNRFELSITFERPVYGIGQRRIAFAGKFEAEDLRTHHGPIVSTVPGVVLQVRAQPGEIVPALQPILVIEAMKIEMPFSLPIDSKISAIPVKEGDRIQPGQTLVIWEPSV